VTGGKKHLGLFLPDFPPEYEDELAHHIQGMEARFFGLTCQDVRRLAYELAHKNGIAHRFNTEKEMAAKKWLYGFLKRNTQITLQKPELTSLARAMGSNKPAVDNFFSLYTAVIQDNNTPPSRIFNCDETGTTTVHKPSKILASKGKHQIGAITSAEQGRNITAVCSMSATVHYIPPAFIFPCKRMKAELMDATPAGSLAFCEGSGWVTCSKYHVQKHASASCNNKMTLIVDGHSSHTKSLEVLEYARANGIIMLSLLPHTTHKMQPMDVAFYKPFQAYYD